MINSPRRQVEIGPALLIFLMLLQPALAQPVNKVLLAEAQPKELPATTQLVGSVRPNRTSVIGAEVEGSVRALPVRQGDYLKKGELICQLKDDTFRLELKAANNKLESLRAAVGIVKADLQRWTLEKQRVAQLSEADKANSKEMYDTLAEFLIAQNRVREAEQEVAEQEALVDLKKIQLHLTMILAPFDGYITRLHTEVGQWLQQGGEVVEMIDLETVLVRVDAPESAILFIQTGEEARVKLDALNDVFTGHVKYIIPQAHEQARTFPVDIEIANPDHKLRSGLFARCTIRSGPVERAIAVPKDAVVHRKGTSRIWMVQDADPQGPMAIPISVTLGAEVSDEDGDWVAITSGNVFAGMRVVIRGNEQLMPFPAPVQIVQEEALISSSPASRGLQPARTSSK